MSYRFVHDEREYCLAPGETLETDLGVLEVPERVAAGDVVETHLGEAFEVRPFRVPDLFEHFERTGAPMLPRDVGLVIGLTGAQSGDRVLDAGTGTGVLAAALGRAGADVLTYEVDEEFAEVARENMALAGLEDRVAVRAGDVTEHLEDLANDAAFDVITLDTADAPAVVARADDLLAPGGYVAVYSPFVEAVREVHAAAEDAGLSGVETRETIQRELDVGERGTRPTPSGVGHTGYLTVARTE